jgi:ketopantoate hydroxymethyltransferase
MMDRLAELVWYSTSVAMSVINYKVSGESVHLIVNMYLISPSVAMHATHNIFLFVSSNIMICDSVILLCLADIFFLVADMPFLSVRVPLTQSLRPTIDSLALRITE